MPMETETTVEASATKKRRTEAPEGRELDSVSLHAPEELTSGPELDGSEQELLRHAEEENEGFDYTLLLPDPILGDIISLLPTKEAARTQILAPRWRRLWSSAPLNLDSSGSGLHEEEQSQANLVSWLLEAHQGPGRRFCVPAFHLQRRLATVDNWLRSPALNNLQELEFYKTEYVMYQFGQIPAVLLPASAFRFSATLRVVTISMCHIPDYAVGALSFPKLQQLGLVGVGISEESLQSIISSSPVLECLLLYYCFGFHSIRINSPRLVSIGLNVRSVNLIVEDAPLLKRLLQLKGCMGMHASVISAPRLETLGCLTDYGLETKYIFGTSILKDLCFHSFATVVPSVKILSIGMLKLDLDTTINLMRCFPGLETLYIKSKSSGGRNLWRRKYRLLVKNLDIRLKTVVLKSYRGIKSQISFATFFVLNAKRLDLMRFEGIMCGDSQFVSEQHRLLQLEKRASSGARFRFTRDRICIRHIKHASELSKADPFECSVCPFR